MALNVGRTIAIFEIGEVGVFSARRYNSAVIGYGPTCLRPCVCLSQAGIVSKQLDEEAEICGPYLTSAGKQTSIYGHELAT